MTHPWGKYTASTRTADRLVLEVTPMSYTLPVRDSDGQLPSFVWPGGYPLFYIDDHSDILCARCATKQADTEDDTPLATCEVNWEDPILYCDECSQRIESAYADDDETPDTVKK
jgi:hypothetical protein